MLKWCELWFDHGVANMEAFEKLNEEQAGPNAITSFKRSIELKCDEERIKRASAFIEQIGSCLEERQ